MAPKKTTGAKPAPSLRKAMPTAKTSGPKGQAPKVAAAKSRDLAAATRGAHVVRVDLRALRLPGPGAGAGWVHEPRIRANDRTEAISVLRAAGLDVGMVDSLQRRLALDSTTHKESSDWPTVGEDRRVLTAAAELARALSTVLSGASPVAEAELATAALSALRDPLAVGRLADELARLGAAVDERVQAMPKQSRARPRVGIVIALHDVAGDVLPVPTTRPDSPFYLACCAAFVLAGYPASPDKAIRRFIELKRG